MQEQAPTLETYKARWADFQTECHNLDLSRQWLAQGYMNEDLDASWEECCERVDRFEARIAHLPVWKRADALYTESIPYEDM